MIFLSKYMFEYRKILVKCKYFQILSRVFQGILLARLQSTATYNLPLYMIINYEYCQLFLLPEVLSP